MIKWVLFVYLHGQVIWGPAIYSTQQECREAGRTQVMNRPTATFSCVPRNYGF